MDPELQTTLDEIASLAKTRVDDLETKLTAEVKFRTDLEKKLNRMSLNISSETKDSALIEAKALALEFMREGTVEGKTLNRGSDPSGGYTVQDALGAKIQDQLINISPIRKVARVVQLGSGNGDYKQPVGRRGASSAWVGEETTRPDTNAPVLGMVAPPGGELMAYAQITQWLLDDSSFDVAQWLIDNINDEHAYQEGVAFATGNGLAKPMGFLTGTPVTTADATRNFGILKYLATGVDGDFAASNPGDKLIDLMFDLSAPYRSGAKWMMNSTTAGKVRKFKEATTNAYLWQPGLGGVPDTLLGYPVTINEDMPDPATGSLSVAFGNFQRGYLIVDKLGVRIVRDEVTRPGWVKFYVFRRVHGALMDSNAIRLLKFATS